MQNQIPKNWQKVKLGEVLAETPQYGYTASSTLSKIGPKLLRITDIQDDFVDWQSVPYCEISEKEKAKYLLELGDIVFARTGNTTGANFYLKNPPKEDVIFASYLIRIRPNKNKCIPEYLAYFLKSRSYWGQVKNLRSGSAQPGINASNLQNFVFELPEDITTQDKIVSILSAFDDKIEVNNKIAKTLEEMAGALFKEWFVKRNGSITNGKFIKDIAQVTSGKRPTKISSKGEINMTVPVYGANEIMGYTDLPLFDERIIITGRVGTIGEVFIVNQRSWPSDNVLVIIPKEEKYTYFLYLFLRRINFTSLNRGSSQPLITQGDLEKYPLPVFNEILVENFHSTVSTFFDKLLIIAQESQKLAALRDLLLPKLMKGEVRV